MPAAAASRRTRTASPRGSSAASTSGWKLYGSRHGARPCSSWCPTSQSWYPVWRWSPGAASPWPARPSAMKDVSRCLAPGHVARDLLRGRGRRRALQRPRCREQLVEVGHLAGIVDAMRGGPYRRARRGRSSARRRPSSRGTRARRRSPGLRRRSSRKGTASRRGRAPGSKRSASSRNRARSRYGVTPASSNSALLSRRSWSSFVQVDDQANRKKTKSAERARDEVLAAGRLARSEPDACVGNLRACFKHGRA